MSNLKIAIDFVLKQEDSRLLGNITTIPGDRGGPTRFGLASASHPELIAQGYYDPAKVNRDAALAIAEQVYEKTYATPMRIADINDQALATAVLSLGVNAWIVKPIKLLQQAVTKLGKPIVVDGHVGLVTLQAVNDLNPTLLLNQFCVEVGQYYRDLVAAMPSDQRFLKGWLNRVDAWLGVNTTDTARPSLRRDGLAAEMSRETHDRHVRCLP
ncbi:type VI secretion system secreted protein VgrG [Silvibacterium bohemicum]|uniref:Type VI secretion system secreted protein VgrG n=1 Tax=Silvibacterium bohemicum TaxID=1577686 RepID=A0A841K379_9BACT|nr:putative peptidoglycan-binding domain-containing protein [Silvibacterium bohemicum]MBB6144704.1 type VI secretion system secreted protein VgrG [Silvibacterium bohemicum]